MCSSSRYSITWESNDSSHQIQKCSSSVDIVFTGESLADAWTEEEECFDKGNKISSGSILEVEADSYLCWTAQGPTSLFVLPKWRPIVR